MNAKKIRIRFFNSTSNIAVVQSANNIFTFLI